MIFDDVDDALSSEIVVHLTSLQKEFLRYFSKISASDLKLVRKSFGVPIDKVRDDQQDKLIDLRNDSFCRDMFDTLSISICKFWAKMCSFYPIVAKECVTKLLLFGSTYLCESGFSPVM